MCHLSSFSDVLFFLLAALVFGFGAACGWKIFNRLLGP